MKLVLELLLMIFGEDEYFVLCSVVGFSIMMFVGV